VILFHQALRPIGKENEDKCVKGKVKKGLKGVGRKGKREKTAYREI